MTLSSVDFVNSYLFSVISHS